DERASLAPRDIVARAIDSEMKKSGGDFVYLDITHRSKSELLAHFPNIYEKCLSIGLDMSKDYIPVTPAAHYLCGGILVNEYRAEERRVGKECRDWRWADSGKEKKMR